MISTFEFKLQYVRDSLIPDNTIVTTSVPVTQVRGPSVINPASCFKPFIEAARVSARVSVARSHDHPLMSRRNGPLKCASG